ncbi:hypothetical protein [Gordonia hongkongensis]|uniref:hypothetical protein n=1 Tax=Gordonia hongkongensis TaxID=1701090 RepID=UPI003EBDD7C3
MGLRARLQNRAAEVIRTVRDKRVERRERKYLETHPSRAADPRVAALENDFYDGLVDCTEKLREIARANSFDINFVPQEPKYIHNAAVAEVNRDVAALVDRFPSDIRQFSVPDVSATCWDMLCALTDHLNNPGFTATRYPDDILDDVEVAMRGQTLSSTFTSDERLQWLVTSYQRPELVPRRCRDRTYAARILAGRFDPHVAPINQYVEELRREQGEWVPYSAPTYGGVNARVLALFQHTGPWVKLSGGDAESTMSLEHPGDFAARHLAFLSGAGIPPEDVQSWNVYPWECSRRPSAGELVRGAPTIARIVSMLPRLEIVVLHGRVTYDAWQYAVNQNSALRRYPVVKTYDTSSLVVSGEPDENERRTRKIADDLAAVSEVLRAADRLTVNDLWGSSMQGRDADGVPYLTEPPPEEDDPPYPDDDWPTSPPFTHSVDGPPTQPPPAASLSVDGFAYRARSGADLRGRVALAESRPLPPSAVSTRLLLMADDDARDHLLHGFAGQFSYSPRRYTADGEILCLDWEYGVPDDCRRIASVLTTTVALRTRHLAHVDLALAVDWYKQRDPDVDSYDLKNTTVGTCVNTLKYRTSGDPRSMTEFSLLVGALTEAINRHPRYARATVIVGVPGHRATGTSLAERLGESVAERTGKRYVRTYSPARPARKGEQRQSVDGMFSVRSTLSGDCIVIDDVMLSGDTLDETARAARAVGAENVFGLVAAKTLRGTA